MRMYALRGAAAAAIVFTFPIEGSAKAVDASMISARQRVFGIEHVDPDTGELPRPKDEYLAWRAGGATD